MIVNGYCSFILSLLILREREHTHASRGRTQSLTCGSISQNHEIMTWAEIKSQMLNWLSHPGAPGYCSFVTCLTLSNLSKSLTLPHFLVICYLAGTSYYKFFTQIAVVSRPIDGHFWISNVLPLQMQIIYLSQGPCILLITRAALLPKSQGWWCGRIPSSTFTGSMLHLLLRKIGSHFLFSDPWK